MKKFFNSLVFLVSLVLVGSAYAQPNMGHQSIVVDDVQVNATTTGAGHVVAVGPFAILGLEITITGTATVQFQATSDITWNSAACFPANGGAAVTSAASSGLYRCNVGGFKGFRTNVSVCTSCTVDAKGILTAAPVNDASGGGGGSGGTSSNFGAAFPSAGTASGFKDSGGTLMQPGNLDSSGSLKVNCAAGCTGAADTVGTLVALNALNAAAAVALAGDQGAGVLIAAGTLAGTVTPELSFDGGTTWVATLFYDPSTNVTAANKVFTNPNSATQLTILISGGASNARVRVSSFTSGTANATLRATGNQGSLPVITIAGLGTQPVSAASLPLPTGAATEATLLTRTKPADQQHAIIDSGTTAVTQTTATNLNAAVVGTGTAGTPAGNILTVQGVASMTKLLVTPDSVALPANQSVNVAQVAGTNTVTGGVAGIIAVGGNVANAVAATANPVPVGGIFTTTPATLTTGQTATQQYTAAQNAKHDLSTIAGTAPSTAGKIDVKGADGDVFVRQATATNLNAAVVGTGTAGTPAGNILTVQGVASMTKLLVTPDSVALPANQSVNVSQVNASTVQIASNGLNTTGAGLQAQAITGQCDDTSPTALTENSFGHARINCTTHHQLIEIAAALPTGPNTIGNVGEVPITSGGTSLSRTVSAASTNATNVKASAGQVYGIQASNVNAAARYLHLYNTAGTPTCNTSIIGTWIIPGNTAGAGTNIPLHPGAAFGTGIGFCITTAVDGTGSVAANELVLMVEYK